MKILFLMTGSEIGGAGICLLRLCNELIKEPLNKISIINTEEGELNTELRKLGINIYVIQSVYVKRFYLPNEIFRLFSNVINFKKIISKETPDIIHAFTLPSARRVFLLKKIGIKLPIVGTIHDELTIEHFGKRKTKFYINCINLKYNCLISVSKSTKNIAVNSGVKEDKIKVIYNGVPLINKNSNKVSNNFTIGNFGRITPSKGQHVIVEAIKLLKPHIPTLKCYIVGKPPLGVNGSLEYYKKLKDTINKYHLQDNVIMIDWTNDINKYYEEIDVYVLSSLNHDPFPTVNLEAMMHKKPVIAVDTGGSKEQLINNETGFIIPPNNEKLLSEKLLYLYNNPEVCKNMGQKGYNHVKDKFSIHTYLKKHVELYNLLIK